MSHLEALVGEYLEWQGYLVKRNTKVGRLKHGGWEMELDIIAFHPKEELLVHYEPSLDANLWPVRERRFAKKFAAGRKYIYAEIFPWLSESIKIRQIAVFSAHPKGRDTIAGGEIISIDELIAEIKAKIAGEGRMVNKAIPEQFPLLRTIQLTLNGYSHSAK